MSKHIVIDAREYSTSSGRYVRNYLDRLEKTESPYHFTVLIHQSDVDAYKPRADHIKVEVVPYEKFTFGEQLGFARYLRSLKADLVHFAFAQQPVLYRRKKVTAILDLTATRFNLAFGISRLVSPFRRAIYTWVVRSGAKHSDHVITISQYVKDELVKEFKVKPDKITVTHCAADSISDKHKPYKALGNKPFILYVGRVQAHKNIKRLVDAHQSLVASHPDLQLVLVGRKDRAYEDLEKYTQRRNAQNVMLTGFVDDATLRWMYQHTQAYVFPSLSEGFGLPGLEAMMHGAPVVSSNATCLPEIYGQAALYFNPNNIEDMATKIDRVLTDTNFQQELIAMGKIQANKYSWQELTDQTLSVYKQVLGE